jgi:Flp pilus assembly protein TadG
MRRWIEKALRLARNRDGNAMLEFAIGAGVLVAAFTGTFQFGYTFLQYNNLENAVARGARYASLVPYDSATTTPSAAFQTAVKNMVLYGSPTAGTSPVLTGLTTGNVSLTVTFANGVPSAMTVSINGYTINSIFTTTNLTNKPQVTYAYQGIWSPI